MTTVIKNIAELEETIEMLEKKKAAEQKQLTDSIKHKMETFKPRNLIKSSVAEFKGNKSFRTKVVLLTLGVIGAIVLKKLMSGRKRGGLKALVAGAAVSGLLKAAMRKKPGGQPGTHDTTAY